MKYSALNVDFNGVRIDPLGSRSPPYECIKFGSPLENVRFLLLSTSVVTISYWLRSVGFASVLSTPPYRVAG